MKLRSLSSSVAHVVLGIATLGLALGCDKVEPPAEPGIGGDTTVASGGDSSGPQPDGPLLPWVVGNNWTYKVTKDGDVELKTTTIGQLEAVGGDGPHADAMAYHVTTAKGTDLKDHTESWQTPLDDTPDRFVRYREESFSATTAELTLDEYWDPEKLHIDGTAEHTVKDATWLETYTETKEAPGLTATTHDVHERWTVIDDDETLTVPKGTFNHVIHFQKVGSSTSKDYWYLRGVGKLKETGTQTEELSDYDLKDAP